jgi:hypothetical protein
MRATEFITESREETTQYYNLSRWNYGHITVDHD